ncbi:HD-GYP domain-containing protein [Sediminispirochaeta smaragdinae]|uniref:HD-GYP domain-containing protein n=1 Tax=Sediminispirochaeta smaragdinae TaxID=55206 RepID=UPI001FE1EFC9|nr:HD domain-containing phosphohydrolase [Sediminispirochaeta smaragdinae]
MKTTIIRGEPTRKGQAPSISDKVRRSCRVKNRQKRGLITNGSDIRQVESIGDLEELTEVEELDEIASSLSPHLDISDLNTSSMLAHTVLPCAVIDETLHVRWANPAFFSFFTDSSPGVGLGKLLSPTLSAEAATLLLAELRSKELHYSTKKGLYLPSKLKLPVELNLLFSPVRKKESKEVPEFWIMMVDDVTHEHRTLLRGTFLSLLEASKLKDNDTGYHIKRVGEYARLLATSMGDDSAFSEQVTPGFIDDIYFLAPMHDVGKIGTPDDILNKEGPLDAREWIIMKEHTINGAYILNSYPNIMAKQIALHHHERWDGNGYPYSLAGDMIPLAARIVTVCDVYDALRMKRSYKDPIPHETSCSIILQGAGTQFDPAIIAHFKKLRDRFAEVHDHFDDEFS